MFLAVIGVIGVMVGLTIEGYEPFLAVSSSFSTMILGAVPLVYARGRSSAISTVICSAVILVALILLRSPQETDCYSVWAPFTNEGGKSPAEKYPFWNFVQGMHGVIGDSYSCWFKIVLVSGGVVCAFVGFLRRSISTSDESRNVISDEYWCGVES
jgi:hypothetical protein